MKYFKEENLVFGNEIWGVINDKEDKDSLKLFILVGY